MGIFFLFPIDLYFQVSFFFLRLNVLFWFAAEILNLLWRIICQLTLQIILYPVKEEVQQVAFVSNISRETVTVTVQHRGFVEKIGLNLDVEYPVTYCACSD